MPPLRELSTLTISSYFHLHFHAHALVSDLLIGALLRHFFIWRRWARWARLDDAWAMSRADARDDGLRRWRCRFMPPPFTTTLFAVAPFYCRRACYTRCRRCPTLFRVCRYWFIRYLRPTFLSSYRLPTTMSAARRRRASPDPFNYIHYSLLFFFSHWLHFAHWYYSHFIQFHITGRFFHYFLLSFTTLVSLHLPPSLIFVTNFPGDCSLLSFTFLCLSITIFCFLSSFDSFSCLPRLFRYCSTLFIIFRCPLCFCPFIIIHLLLIIFFDYSSLFILPLLFFIFFII